MGFEHCFHGFMCLFVNLIADFFQFVRMLVGKNKIIHRHAANRRLHRAKKWERKLNAGAVSVVAPNGLSSCSTMWAMLCSIRRKTPVPQNSAPAAEDFRLPSIIVASMAILFIYAWLL